MIELGKVQKLRVASKTPKGIYLKSKYDVRKVFLPTDQIESEVSTELGDEVVAFVYKDVNDNLVATTKKPKITMDKLVELNVVDNTKFGAFLDWGLPKDLLLPTKEQRGRISKGKKVLVGLFIDKKDHLCATMDIYKLLSDESPFRENDTAYGRIYAVKPDMGALVAVEDKYHGLIPKHELFGDIVIGDKVELRVTKVREDGKLYLSMRQKAYKQMDQDAQVIIKKLKEEDGTLGLNDNSDAEVIKKKLGMSKRAFKRAIGRLLKEGKIEFINNGIKLK